jgi:uncharacterized Fe-S center protein
MRARKQDEGLLHKVLWLFDAAGFDELISPDDLVALKLHFGEQGNTAFIRPLFIRQIVDRIKKLGGKPFLTDSGTLYIRTRTNAVDHLNTAIMNGFAYPVVGAPILVADGLLGHSSVDVLVNLKYFDTVHIASDIYYSNAAIVVTHFKGHISHGFGGTIKNIAMGCANRKGKQEMHCKDLPKVDSELCNTCGICVEHCPAGAIQIVEEVAIISRELCMGCLECTHVCPCEAISAPREATHEMHEKMAEYALGIVRNSGVKFGHMCFLTAITPDCDCNRWADAPIVPDLGILASDDPVAIDQAAVDLVNKHVPLSNTALSEKLSKDDDKWQTLWPEIYPYDILEYAEKIGLGSRNYKLVTLERAPEPTCERK